MAEGKSRSDIVRDHLYNIVTDPEEKAANRVAAARVFLATGDVAPDDDVKDHVDKLYNAIQWKRDDTRLV